MAFRTTRVFRKRSCLHRHLAIIRSKNSEAFNDKPLRIHSWKVMFFGTDDFSIGSLTKLKNELKSNQMISKLEIVTSKWHLNPVKLFGQKEGLVVHDWPIAQHALQGFDIGVVASFGHLIPKRVIEAFPLGMVNVHGSLLPRWRGAAPVNYAIMHGDTVTGVSIMRIRPHTFDKGEVLSRQEVSIHPNETALELRARLSEVGGKELISCMQRLPECLEDAHPQPEEGICYAPKLTPELGVIDFKKMTAKCIFDRFRALYGIIPIVTTWMDLKLILHEVSLNNETHSDHTTPNPSTKFTFGEGSVPGSEFGKVKMYAHKIQDVEPNREKLTLEAICMSCC
ncbi:hypothetical protein ONE63_007769 [Megalurothrips usitatus]|uniref:methionyl-tRNA formyltransferase n=1 Tax=Megalurothrips usitatus TaxID=439358 RepID=A0AAV7XSY5_9NEOP|nr:hypothetical protein ONE63_007769 [Megalurothrips usitatus]